MSINRHRIALAVCAGLAFALLPTLILPSQVHARHRVNKSITFDMPPCPIKAKRVAPSKTEFQLPRRNPLGEPVSVTGTIQWTDQTGSTVILLAPVLTADQTGLSFSRTVKTLQHATGELTFDKGCTKTDPYGSNNCTWVWGEQVTLADEGALQEDITAGKLIVDLKIDTTIPLQFSCSICGAPCTVSIPPELDHGRWNRIWEVAMYLLGHPHGPGGDEDQQ